MSSSYIEHVPVQYSRLDTWYLVTRARPNNCSQLNALNLHIMLWVLFCNPKSYYCRTVVVNKLFLFSYQDLILFLTMLLLNDCC